MMCTGCKAALCMLCGTKAHLICEPNAETHRLVALTWLLHLVAPGTSPRTHPAISHTTVHPPSHKPAQGDRRTRRAALPALTVAGLAAVPCLPPASVSAQAALAAPACPALLLGTVPLGCPCLAPRPGLGCTPRGSPPPFGSLCRLWSCPCRCFQLPLERRQVQRRCCPRTRCRRLSLGARGPPSKSQPCAGQQRGHKRCPAAAEGTTWRWSLSQGSAATQYHEPPTSGSAVPGGMPLGSWVGAQGGWR